MYRLIFESGRRAGQVYDADETAVVDLGRDPSCKIVLDESGVSRRHTVIQQLEDGVYISDLSSTNGTYVNGVRIATEQRLKPGDRVEIGAAQFSFQLAPPLKPGQPRRRGKLFAVALISIGAIILIELIALGVTWVSRRSKTTEPMAARSTNQVTMETILESAAPASPTNLLDETQKQLDAKLQRAEELAQEISQGKANSQAGLDALAGELKTLRTDIDSLKTKLDEIAARTPSSTPPPAPVADPILERARQMVAEADRAKMLGKFDEAIRILQSATILVPNHAPAYKAMAEIYEMRGLMDEAKAAWQKIVAQGPAAGPLYNEANQRLQEMARKEASSKLPEMKPLVKPGVAAAATARTELPHALRIVEMQKLAHPEDQSVDERYDVKFLVRAQTGEKFVAPEEVRIEVKFYDKLDTGEVVETNAETPDEFKVPAVWESFDRKAFTATYRAAKGLRKKETEETGKKRHSYGYIVRLYYRGKLQDERSEPEKLAGLISSQASNDP